MTAPDDPLAEWWVWPVLVERCTGTGTFGKTYDPPVEILARITTKRRLIVGPDGSEVVSEARISMPVGTPLIPVESRVTLPSAFGGRPAAVLADQLHHGGEDIPNFYSIDVA
ncbi:hypothetical protein [Rhodococcus ruber]|uniref:hypothetical protein n=1 Tax=Rhodococcus ruber TaxID=1830 RepID=UPI003783DC09